MNLVQQTAEAPEPETCDWCGHFFDPTDSRSYISKTTRDKWCPLCWFEQHGGTEAWAVWNSCNGIFSCCVTDTRKGAQEIIEKNGMEGDRVVPVRVFKETDDRVTRRHRDEDDNEAYWEKRGNE